MTITETEWVTGHRLAFGRIKSMLNLAGCATYLDIANGVVPALARSERNANGTLVEVAIVSPKGNLELSGYVKWTVYTIEIEEGEVIDEQDFEPEDATVLLDIAKEFIRQCNDHLPK